MFETLQKAQPDAILGLAEAFKKDPTPGKINLTVGVYKDKNGSTPVLESVRAAEARIFEKEKSKGYMPIDGAPEYAAAVQKLMFGADHEVVTGKRAATAHTPGGTGALRVAADFLAQKFPGRAVWMSDPTWPNHPSIFQAAGLTTKSYPYFSAAKNVVDFDAMLEGIERIPEGDVVLLHGCCHNPTGADPSPAQWNAIAEVCAARNLLPFLDFAYQGFAEGIAEDAAGLLALTRPGRELLVASSFSKNFGLYNERVGALTVVAANEDAADSAMGHVKLSIRTNYSNPPAHGGIIVTTILGDAALRQQWAGEVAAMRSRINGMRTLFVETMHAKHPGRDFSFIKEQRGMFSFSGLTKAQVERLRTEFGLYIVGSGRINVAGMTEANMDALCTAIAAVL